jgi:hypothetical protein
VVSTNCVRRINAEFSFEYGPPETADLYTLYPLTGVAPGFQDSVTWFEDACAPTPDKEIVAGEFVALLLTVTLPVTAVVADGAKLRSSVAVCPGVRTWPVETPAAVNPDPEMLTFEMVTFELPAFVRATPCTLSVPILMLPKTRFVVFGFKADAEGDDEVAAEVVEFAVLGAPVTPVHPA